MAFFSFTGQGTGRRKPLSGNRKQEKIKSSQDAYIASDRHPSRARRNLVKAAGATLIGLALIGVNGCSNLNKIQERSLSGGAIGAGAGAVAVAATGGCVTCGAVIGGAVGAGAGYIYDQAEKDK